MEDALKALGVIAGYFLTYVMTNTKNKKVKKGLEEKVMIMEEKLINAEHNQTKLESLISELKNELKSDINSIHSELSDLKNILIQINNK